MQRYTVHPSDPFCGIFTDLFILGTTRNVGASDFSDADTSQTYTLVTPAAGDVVIYPLALAYTKVGFAGGALSAVELDLGFTGTLERFIISGAMFTLNAVAPPPQLNETGGPKAFDGATALTATLTSTGANFADITAGEIWIYLNLLRFADFVAKPYG